MGDVPDWYEVIVAAKYLGVAPWELEAQPLIWKRWALAASAAEGSAKKNKQSSASRKAGG